MTKQLNKTDVPTVKVGKRGTLSLLVEEYTVEDHETTPMIGIGMFYVEVAGKPREALSMGNIAYFASYLRMEQFAQVAGGKGWRFATQQETAIFRSLVTPDKYEDNKLLFMNHNGGLGSWDPYEPVPSCDVWVEDHGYGDGDPETVLFCETWNSFHQKLDHFSVLFVKK